MKALVKVGLAAITISFVIGIAGFLISSLSQTGGSALDDVEWGNIEINFNKSYNSITYQEFEFYIKQNYSPTGLKVNISNIVNETNFGINDLNRIEFYTREKVSYNYDRVSFTYSEGSNNTGLNITNSDDNYIRVSYLNGTSVDISKSNIWNFKEHSSDGWYTLNRSNPVTEILTADKWVWEEAKDAVLNKNLEIEKVTTRPSTITIPASNETDEYGNPGTKWFKVVIHTPIEYHNGGWGSKGSFAVRLDDANNGYEKHPPWDGSWEKRKDITMTNSIDAQNFVVEYNLTWETGMNSNFSDIRFVNASENEELPFTIWGKKDGSWAYGFVRMNLTSSGIQGYLYFNNPSASYGGNNYTVFDFYDDFNGNALDASRWNVSTSVTVSSGNARWNANPSRAVSSKDFPQNTTIEFHGIASKIFEQFTSIGYQSATGLANNNSKCDTNANAVCFYHIQDAGESKMFALGKSAGTSLDLFQTTGYDNVFLNYSIRRNGSTSMDFLTVNSAGSRVSLNQTSNIAQGNLGIKIMTFADIANTGNVTMDWIRVRSYRATMPAVSFGSAEDVGSAVNETAGRSAIEEGIKDSLGNDITIYTDQQIYARYVNTTQQLARFDKVTKYGNQIWAFNYVNGSTPFANMQNITPAFYVRELANMTVGNIQPTVSDFINKTKVS